MGKVDRRQAAKGGGHEHERHASAERLPEHIGREGHAAVRREAVERDRERKGDAEGEQHADRDRAGAGGGYGLLRGARIDGHGRSLSRVGPRRRAQADLVRPGPEC